MSVGNKPHYLNSSHPNFKRWKRSAEISFERGKFVKEILSQYKELSNLKILDIGSGFGGTIKNLIGNGNEIFSVEIDEFKLAQQINHPSVKKFCVDAFALPFKEKFDLIILQDFFEHIDRQTDFLKYISNYLNKDGLIYLSTPNRNSLINIISDPHWGFPIVSLLSRHTIKKFFIPIFRKIEKGRKDIAELKSLDTLIKIFQENDFKFILHTKFAVKVLLKNPEQIIWSDLHLSFLKIIKHLKLQNILLKIANDKVGFVNKYLTPTFYFVLTKKENANQNI
ncbi:MAG: class I SAM-dependent methyltransferase [Ignavibacteria bacterium]|nr:class I SAM-dependent methyltransferase [Ignavibacteria bacterium]